MGVLGYFSRLARNTELMQEMFSRVGINGWFAQNPHGSEVLRRAALRCGNCTHDAECAQWLEDHATADAAPDFCRNHDLVERIVRDLQSPA
ncbi:MAG: hypothetical protein JJ913_16820 [Rhizobiaceae bacterium]|nr:hypothetical protein [Rhizobiaceae bacterium]